MAICVQRFVKVHAHDANMKLLTCYTNFDDIHPCGIQTPTKCYVQLPLHEIMYRMNLKFPRRHTMFDKCKVRAIINKIMYSFGYVVIKINMW